MQKSLSITVTKSVAIEVYVFASTYHLVIVHSIFKIFGQFPENW